jgi:4-amino-4-deoxy-L-arabinose transferase-like glycosyltransferase
MNRAPSKRLASPVVAGVLIFIVGLGARALWAMTLKNDLYWADERAFTEIARHLARNEGYISESYRANPVFPFYLSLVFRFFGENLFVARLGQCIAGALTCVLIYGIGVHLFGRMTGVISGVLLAVYPPHIYLSGVLYVECMLIFWGAVTAYLAVRSMQASAHSAWGLATGAALALAVLTRSTLIVWMPSVWLAWLWQARAAWRTRLPLCGALLLGSTSVIVPWTIRNYLRFHSFVPVSSGFGTLLWQANNPLSTGLDHRDWDLFPNSAVWNERLARLPAEQQSALESQYNAVEARIRELNGQLHDQSLASDRVLMPLAVRYIALHPLQTLVRSCRRLRLLFSAFSPTITTNEHTSVHYKAVAALSFYPVLALAVLGMTLSLARFRDVALLYLLIASVAAMTALLLGTQTRYRLPVDPYLILFASAALVRLWSWSASRGRDPTVDFARGLAILMFVCPPIHCSVF